MSVFILLLVLTLLQAPTTPADPPPAVRGDRFQLIVPQGWKTLNEGGFVLLQHTSGASLLVQRISRTTNLENYAHRQAERIMMPLGFAQIGEPVHFKDGTNEWVEFEITGNRLSNPHRIAYRVIRRSTSYYESVYEAPKEQFEILLTEAQGIIASVQTVTPARRRP